MFELTASLVQSTLGLVVCNSSNIKKNLYTSLDSWRKEERIPASRGTVLDYFRVVPGRRFIYQYRNGLCVFGGRGRGRRTRTRVMLQVILVMLHVFRVMLHVLRVSCNVTANTCNITRNTCNTTGNMCNITRNTCNITRNTCNITRVRVRVRRIHKAIGMWYDVHCVNLL